MAQSGHSISQFILENHDLARQWNNNYLISLSIETEQKLSILLDKIQKLHVPVSYFTEPDFGDELTSICFIENEQTESLTKKLRPALINI